MDVVPVVERQVRCAADTDPLPAAARAFSDTESAVSADLLTRVYKSSVQSRAFSSAHTFKILSFGSIPLFGCMKIQCMLGQPSEAEIGCPNAWGIENGHMCICQTPKWYTSSLRRETQKKKP